MWIALLRAVNLGPHGKVSMADLKAMLTGMGLTNPRTLLQSGNAVFDAEQVTEAELETQAAKELGLGTDFFLRSAGEWAKAIEDNPFPNIAKTDPSHLLMLVLKTEPKPGAVEELQAAIKGREQVGATGRQLYATYPDGIGESKLTIGVIERHLGTRTTGRNWNTVLKLRDLAAG